MTLVELHTAFSWFVVVSTGVAGVWTLAANWVPAIRYPGLWALVAVGMVSVVVQAVIGTILVAVQDREPAEFHMFYGFVALASVGLIYSYRNQMKDQRFVLYGAGSLFLMGLGIRAMLLRV